MHVAGVENVATEFGLVQGPAEANQVEPIQKPRAVEPKRHPGVPFTKENAAAMAQRGRERKAAREAEARRIAELGAQSETEYCKEQVTRVRGHIERLHRKIETCPNAKDLQALSQALKNITELETKLRTPTSSPRSTPGSRSSTVSPVE